MDALRERARNPTWGLVFLLLAALVLRLAMIGDQPAELTQDRDAYLGIATSLLERRGYSSPDSTQPTAFRPPVYPLLLAFGILVFPVPVAVGGINVIAGLLTVWLTERLGNCLGLGRYRFIAAGLVAIDPLLLRYTVQPMTESLCTFLAALLLWSLVTVSTSPCANSWYQRFGCGFAFGLLVLCRPTFWPLAVFFCWNGGVAFGQLFWQQDRRARMKVLLSMLSCPLGTLLVVAPWLIRNWLVLGVPILTTTHGGYTLLLSNNPVFYQEVVQRPWGTVWQLESLTNWQSEMESQIQHQLGSDASEVARDRWYVAQARQSIAATPRLFAGATLHRIRSLWNTVPQGEAAEQTASATVIAVGWYYSLVLTVGLLGMVLVAWQDRRHAWLPLYALIATVQLAHLFYWTNARMRAPLTPALSLFAAVSVMPWRRTHSRAKQD